MNATVDKESQVANLQLWIAALRSKKYTQGRGRLRKDDEYCCLGVACDLMNPLTWERATYNREGWTWPGMDFRLIASLDDEVRAAFGLTLADESALTEMNDCAAVPFPLIATYIEHNILLRVSNGPEVTP